MNIKISILKFFRFTLKISSGDGLTEILAKLIPPFHRAPWCLDPSLARK